MKTRRIRYFFPPHPSDRDSQLDVIGIENKTTRSLQTRFVEKWGQGTGDPEIAMYHAWLAFRRSEEIPPANLPKPNVNIDDDFGEIPF